MNKLFRQGFFTFLMFACASSAMAQATGSTTAAPANPPILRSLSQQDIASTIYRQCSQAVGANAGNEEKQYCASTAKKIAGSFTPQQLMNMSASAGPNATREDMIKMVQSDPRFSEIIKQCMMSSLGIGGIQ